jgi:peptidoglycan/LPS O-acetylase OafA/YrhL
MKRIVLLDIARIFAAFMVASGHLMLGGNLSTSENISRYISINEKLPLLDKLSNSMWQFDFLLLSRFGTAFAILGVAIFFVISGWLMPDVVDVYGRKKFIINRFFRIYPMLIVGVLLSLMIQVFVGKAAEISIWNVLSTLTLSSSIFGQNFCLGVVWTLSMEFAFYIVIFVMGNINHTKILLLNLFIYIIFMYNFFIENIASFVFEMLYYISFLFVFSSLNLAFRIGIKNRKYSIFVFFLSLVTFEISRLIIHKYNLSIIKQDFNMVTQTVVCIFFVMLLYILKLVNLNKAMFKIIKILSDITYSLYLLHLSIGVFLLAIFRHYIYNPYLLMMFVFIVVITISIFTHKYVEVKFMSLFKTIYQV